MKTVKKTSVDRLMDWIIWGDKKEFYNPIPYEPNTEKKQHEESI